MSGSKEFVLQSGKTPLLIVKPYSSAILSAMKKLERDPTIQLAECNSSLDAVSVARHVDSCAILCYAVNSDALVTCVTLLKLLTQQIKRGQIRTLLLTQVKHTLLHSKLKFYGCTEIVLEPIPEKSLLFKIERHLKALPGPHSVSSVDKASEAHLSSVAPGIRLVPALELESDCWLFEGREPKWVNNRWVVHLIGPGPKMGRWVEMQVQQGSVWGDSTGDRSWQWVPCDGENDPFVREMGAWTFNGYLPRFEGEQWMFIGSRPRLAFQHDGENYGSKIDTQEDNMILLAADSENARSLLPALEASQEAVYVQEGSTPPASQEEGVVLHTPSRVPENFSGVRMSPIALAYLASELQGKRSMSPEQRIKRYTDYLNQACQGMHVEIFLRNEARWAEIRDLVKPNAASVQGERLLSPVISDGDEVIGAISIAGAGVEQIPLPYAEAVAKMGKGILQGVGRGQNSA